MRTIFHDLYDGLASRLKSAKRRLGERLHQERNLLSIRWFFLKAFLFDIVSSLKERVSSFVSWVKGIRVRSYVATKFRKHYSILRYFVSLFIEFAIYGALLTYAVHMIGNVLFGLSLPVHDARMFMAYGALYYFVKLELPEIVNSLRRR